ncbi:hypothetical protein AB0G04_22175 [Actinoplanes sp. NPDC023801]|uniref:hypothetical protein n=1 Tax=Actinoplanes sp. NPDC023801 TaxID=3154595 RepID=UPI0033CD4EE6
MPLLDPGRRRQWRQHVEPAAVILAGVLAATTVGVIIHSRATHGDPPAAAAPTVAAPTAEQVPIPLPSATPTPSMTPIDSIVVERVPVAATVDLDAEGTVDWVHWGEQGRFSLERDRGGDFTILEGTPGESRQRHTASPERFTWTGGEPMAASSGVTSGIRTCGAGNGFTLSAPATTGSHTLKLYVGVIEARGSLRLRLSTGGEAYIDHFEGRGDSMATTAYVVSYRASGTGKISIKWITDAAFDEDCGGVALQAATLS